jgi:hypothetical protein
MSHLAISRSVSHSFSHPAIQVANESASQSAILWIFQPFIQLFCESSNDLVGQLVGLSVN